MLAPQVGIGSKVWSLKRAKTIESICRAMAQRRSRSRVEKRQPVKQTELCAFFSQGKCTRGRRCTFAHGIAELRRRPDLYKTKLCASYSLWKQCPYGEDCTHAHGQEELRSVESGAVFSDSKETFSTESVVCDSELSVSSAVNQFGLPNPRESPMMYFDCDAGLNSDGGYPIATPDDYIPPWGSLLHQMQFADLHHVSASPHSNMEELEFLAAQGHHTILSL
eukprot:s549_g24.t1